jgi:predicted Zn-dependent protease
MVTATQIRPPENEQDFERACKVLFQGELKTPSVQLYGRKGQSQYGIDLVGYRDGDADKPVGVQCKLVKLGNLTESDIQTEVDKSIKGGTKGAYKLKELIVVTTKPNDVNLINKANTITQSLKGQGIEMRVSVWGWDEMQTRIRQYPDAVKAFDPTFDPYIDDKIDKLEEKLERTLKQHTELLTTVNAGIQAALPQATSDSTTTQDVLEKELNKEIDNYRDLINAGKANSALGLLESRWNSLTPTASGNIKFRIRANIAACHLQQNNEELAAKLYLEAYDFAPKEPKAIANKALALLLQAKPQEALDFAQDELEKDPSNEILAGFLIQAASYIDTISDPSDLVPVQLKDGPHVLIGLAQFYRNRNLRPKWWEEAHKAVKLHPQDIILKRFSADAALEEVFANSDGERPILSKEQKDLVINATNALQDIWNKEVINSESTLINPAIALGCNLINGYRLLHEYDKALKTIKEGISKLGDNEDFTLRGAVVFAEKGDFKQARKYAEKLNTSQTEKKMILMLSLVNTNDWQGILEIYGNIEAPDGVPNGDKAMWYAIKYLASIKANKSLPTPIDEEKLLADYPDDIRVRLILSRAAKAQGNFEKAEKLYDEAMVRFKPDSSYAETTMLAGEASENFRWNDVIKVLDTQIDKQKDSPELRNLARAYVNTPPTKKSVEFAKEVNENIKDNPFYLRVASHIAFNRGALTQAETFIRQSITLSPDTLFNHLTLLHTLLRQDKYPEIEAHLDSLTHENLNGTAIEKMRLAKFMVMRGNSEKAVALAYKTVSEELSPEVCQYYMGLLIPNTDRKLIPDVEGVVKVDCHVLLEDEDKKQIEIVIEDGGDKPQQGIYSPQHTLAKGLLGLKAGETFEWNFSGERKRSYKILQVAHKYLKKLHQIMENFEVWFPEARGFYSIRTEGHDVTPILDKIKKFAEQKQKRAEIYTKHRLPLAVLANLLGENVIHAAGFIRSIAGTITTCSGLVAERKDALKTIEDNPKQSCVLDTYTLWVAYKLEILPVLKKIFKRVIVAQSSLDEIREWREKEEINITSGYMTLGYHEGKFIREEYSPEQVKSTLDDMNQCLSYVEKELTIMPAESQEELTPIEEKLIEITDNAHVLDAAHITKRENALLISDDQYMRNAAKQFTQVEGIWLQVALEYALANNYINLDAYAKQTSGLAFWQHNHVSLNALTLIALVKRKDDLACFQIAVDYIGTKTADLASHISVVATFMGLLWREDLPWLTKARASGLILDKLFRFRTEDANFVLSTLGKHARAIRDDTYNPIGSRYLDYLITWAKGNFFFKK